ncbi:TTK protein kinase [Vavraia culicis subsp. floridensis]|uniref:TTK protein kinase n=1 Tax=Vavraia culicis (isolate floridensis) TaxID=948595 RepID=L2GXC1_VAVCU|nr:TTK protein kinase [Vavraia culicis subsp. floridensis]ELA47997.1 TTK protein kinase [Vavraia culicis subsp. floridensis]
MEGVFNSRDLYDYLQHHLSTNTTVTHKLSMYFKATQKPFDPDHYMLQIWLDYIQLLIETEDDINDIKSTLYILRKGYYRFKEYWTVYLSFEERFFGVDKRMKFVTESVRFLESKREFEGKKEIIGFLMAAQGHNRTGDRCSGLANSDGSELLSGDLKGTGWNVPIVNEINDGMSASTKGNLCFTNKVSLDTAIYHTPSSLNENKINCPIEKEDYTESITESLDKMMNRRLKRCGFDGTSIGDSKLGIEPSSRNYDVVRSIRSVRRSIERDFGTTSRNMDRVMLNGKELQVLSVIGKGGSSKVYKVSYSDNFFALKVIKNVTDRKILQSYENEINLMIKLKGTAETIELCDYAINQDEEGYTILLLMEYGESDLTHLLKNKELKTKIFSIFFGKC